MARLGKGAPMADQARAILRARFLDLSSRHAAKQATGAVGSRSTGLIHSVATWHKYTSALACAGDWMRERYGLRQIGAMTADMADAYLEQRINDGIGQKQLDADRNALEFLVGPLDRAMAKDPAPKAKVRAYDPRQIAAIMRHQAPHNARSTHLAWRTGMRAHELLTLQRRNEAAPSTHRTWHPRRFVGRAGGLYVVNGKGGLVREVMVEWPLADLLESDRRPEPVEVTDRGIRYLSWYDIAGGNAWSQSVSLAAQSALGWSTGAHGLRHTYARERFEELQRAGFTWNESKEILSQELGHFRPSITDVYLR